MQIFDFVLTETSVLNHIEFAQTQYIPKNSARYPFDTQSCEMVKALYL